MKVTSNQRVNGYIFSRKAVHWNPNNNDQLKDNVMVIEVWTDHGK